MSEILISSTCNQKTMCFFKVFCDSLFFLETLLTRQCTKCLFHMDIRIYQADCVTCVEKVSRWNSVSKNIYKKKILIFFWLLVEDIKISYIFLKIKNFQGILWTSIIKTCFIKLLRIRPLGPEMRKWKLGRKSVFLVCFNGS